jgi:hypothetical protein
VVDRVAYGSNIVDINTSAPLHASPFVKSPVYADQSEFRIILVPKKAIDRDHVTVSGRSATRFLTEQFRNYSIEGKAAPQTDPPQRPSADIINELERAVAEAALQRREVDELRPPEAPRTFEGRIIRLYWELRRQGDEYRDELVDRAIVEGTLRLVIDTQQFLDRRRAT